jgi:hypothetical protein
MDSVLTITLLIGIGAALLLARRLDDPIGRELDDMRGETELQALLTPLFASRPLMVGNACGGRVPIDGNS